MRPLWLLVLVGCASTPTPPPAPGPRVTVTLPATSLTERERTTHALHRLAFGPSEAERERIGAVGLAAWLGEQLTPGVDPAMAERLSGFKTLDLTVADAIREYPRPDQRARALGVDVKTPEGQQAVKRMARENPDELPRQLLIELTQAKLLRAANSKRQLEEVLVDFWFNHFNVSAEKNRVRWMVNAYEREAIRPHVFGRFRDLLGATAKHPAMLWYLDNWMSVRDGFELPAKFRRQLQEDDGQRRELGLNENYARELLELHTVGVNAGYTQQDVREAARALTGWGLELRQRQSDFGRFEFHPAAHDDGPKQVFGLSLVAGNGQQDGERLLDHLAKHPATARHLSLKLCQRLVSDTPSPALVERVAAVFLASDGDLTATYRAIIESPEFWSPEAVGTKTRSPLEFVVGAIRAVGTLDEAQRPLAGAAGREGGGAAARLPGVPETMISRRRLLQSLAAFGAAPAFAQAPASKKTLVVVFLRGGVDGLSLVPPAGDKDFAALRSSTAVKGLRLDAFFGLHPAMAPLLPLFEARKLAVVHATGLPTQPRSHFEAQDFLEAGTPGRRMGEGWLNRAGRDLGGSAFSMVAVQNGLPVSMSGDASALAFPSLKDFRVLGGDLAATTFEALYDQAVDQALRTSGHDAFESLNRLKHEGLADRPPQNGAQWPRTALGRRLQDIARLIHADVGLSIAATEVGGFDTHLAQGGDKGQLANRLEEVAGALAAFAQDLGPRLADVTLLTMTEFGRTAKENGTRGTDHGTASVSLVLGGGVAGGRVVADWPGLSPAALFEGRDLKVTTDLRSVMSECLDSVGLRRRDVFPDFTPGRVGLFG